MAVFGHSRMPSLGGATGWLSSEPLGPTELRDSVVLALAAPSQQRGVVGAVGGDHSLRKCVRVIDGAG
jgi:hypothetical protein